MIVLIIYKDKWPNSYILMKKYKKAKEVKFKRPHFFLIKCRQNKKRILRNKISI